MLAIWLAAAPHLELGRYEEFESFATTLTNRIGVDMLPPGQLYSLRRLSQSQKLPVLRGLTEEHANRLRHLYREDFETLGYDDLTAAMEDPRVALAL